LITNNLFSNNGIGIGASGYLSQPIINGNNIIQESKGGIRCWDSGDLLINDNLIVDCGQYGIESISTDIYAHNCTITGATYGIKCISDIYFRVFNCILAGNTVYGIKSEWNNYGDIVNCTIAGNY